MKAGNNSARRRPSLARRNRRSMRHRLALWLPPSRNPAPWRAGTFGTSTIYR